MAVLKFSAELIAGLVFDLNIGGTCLLLARQDIRLNLIEFEQLICKVRGQKTGRKKQADACLKRLKKIKQKPECSLDDEQFFKLLGFSKVISVDFSDFENATILHDLNETGLAKKIDAQVDFVVETGTAEHVFNIPVYLQNICESMAENAVVFHAVPANNYVDHGFYQFSPTLFYDFYSVNSFETLDMAIVTTGEPMWVEWEMQRYEPGEFDSLDLKRFQDRFVVLAIAMKKLTNSSATKIPQQRTYRENQLWNHLPTEEILTAEMILAGGPFEHLGGNAWQYPIAATICQGDNVTTRNMSRLRLKENGLAIGPPYTNHKDIAEHGCGGYSHWGEYLIFSSSDNSDPNNNGKAYSLHLLAERNTCFYLSEKRKEGLAPLKNLWSLIKSKITHL